MKVIIVEPMKKPIVKEIGDDLKSLQEVVGGFIEAIYPYEDLVALVCNEEGKISGLPYNRVLRDETGKICDVIAGTFFIAGLGEEDFTSLTDDQIKKFTKIFELPEVFTRKNGKILVQTME